jgi:hypothetical protein
MNKFSSDPSTAAYYKNFARMQQKSRRSPIVLLPSEVDLFIALDWLDLPQYGSGWVSDPNAALRRKNVAAEIEEDLWPVLGDAIEAEEDSNSPDVDVDMQDFYSEQLEFQDSEISLSIICRSEYFERVKGIRIPI